MRGTSVFEFKILVCGFKGIIHPTMVIIYSPSRQFKPVFLSVFWVFLGECFHCSFTFSESWLWSGQKKNHHRSGLHLICHPLAVLTS